MTAIIVEKLIRDVHCLDCELSIDRRPERERSLPHGRELTKEGAEQWVQEHDARWHSGDVAADTVARS